MLICYYANLVIWCMYKIPNHFITLGSYEGPEIVYNNDCKASLNLSNYNRAPGMLCKSVIQKQYNSFISLATSFIMMICILHISKCVN